MHKNKPVIVLMFFPGGTPLHPASFCLAQHVRLYVQIGGSESALRGGKVRNDCFAAQSGIKKTKDGQKRLSE